MVMVESRKERLVKLCDELEKEANEALTTLSTDFNGNHLVSAKVELSEIGVSSDILREEERLKHMVYESKENGDLDTALNLALTMKKLNGGRNSKADKLLVDLYIEFGDFESAKKHLSYVFDFCKYDPRAYVQYAELLYKTGEYQNAIKAINMSFAFENNNRSPYSNSILISSYIKLGYNDLFNKKMTAISKKYVLSELLKFYRCCVSKLTEDEILSYLPFAFEAIKYDEYAKREEKIIDEFGYQALNSYISNLDVSSSFKALMMLNAARLCEERKLANLSLGYIKSARSLDDGSINIKKYAVDTEKKVRFLKNSKRGVK